MTSLDASAIKQEGGIWPISAFPPRRAMSRRLVCLLRGEARLVQHQALVGQVWRARVAAAGATAACATRLASGIVGLMVARIGRYWRLAMLGRAVGVDVDVRHVVEV